MTIFKELFRSRLGVEIVPDYHELLKGYYAMSSGQRSHYGPLELLCSAMEEFIRSQVMYSGFFGIGAREDASDISWALNRGVLSALPTYVDELWRGLQAPEGEPIKAQINEFMEEFLRILHHVLNDSTAVKAELLFHKVREVREALEGTRTDALLEVRPLCDRLWSSGYESSDVEAFLRSILAVDLLGNEPPEVSGLVEELQELQEHLSVEELWRKAAAVTP